MAIISNIGRKHFKTRILLFAIVCSLALGSITMIYPFMLMLAGSSKSNYDKTEFSVVPAFYRSAEKALTANTWKGFLTRNPN